MDHNTWQATIGSGTLLDDITKKLHDNGKRAMAHGTCPQVGIGGHATIGGLGPTSRMWGASLDHIEEVEVVLANGTVARASDSENSDLFWALKGAGASFGIITEFKVKTHPEPGQTVQYSYTFTPDLGGSSEDVASVFEAWQTLVSDPNLSRKFASQVWITEVGMILSGTFFGTEAEYDQLGIEDALPFAPAHKSIELTDFLGAVSQWASDVGQEAGGGIPNPFYAKSLALRNDTLMSSDTIKQVFKLMLETSIDDKGTPAWFVIFDLEGGAVSDVPQTATAYAHRDALFYLQSYALGVPSVSDKTKEFLTNVNGIIEDGMPDGVTLGAYPGYIDPDLGANAQELYWGENYPRLQEVKRKYDPGDVFHNPQVSFLTSG